ncbi:ankyrin repeat domain-containing protein [Leptospira ellisii]|uniref:ankyrin repeat domain-containing protein n=1 Tax=Leptospira ellisii TaxID=2023197 RepID=UPI001A9FE112|nr:ankyrin repeat domain-containing protein [Leptospira ellisii]
MCYQGKHESEAFPMSLQDLNEDLLKAIRAEDETKIKELISQGADPNRLTYIKSLEVPLRFDALPISFSGGVTFKSKALSILLENGAELNAADKNGSKALQYLVSYCKEISRFIEAVTYLVSAGSDINEQKEAGRTILYSAVSHGDPKKVEFLLQAGADPNSIREKEGESPLLRACINSDKNPEEIRKIVELLIQAGADVNARETWKGRTSLMWAVQNGNFEIAKRLVEAGADTRTENSKGNRNAYLMALEGNRSEIALWLEGIGAKDESLRPFRDLQFENIQKEAWKESIEAGLKAIVAFPEDWKIPFHISLAHKKLGFYEESDRWAQTSLVADSISKP